MILDLSFTSCFRLSHRAEIEGFSLLGTWYATQAPLSRTLLALMTRYLMLCYHAVVSPSLLNPRACSPFSIQPPNPRACRSLSVQLCARRQFQASRSVSQWLVCSIINASELVLALSCCKKKKELIHEFTKRESSLWELLILKSPLHLRSPGRF